MIKCVRRWGIDRISELPDDIITRILSFLPLKDAVATSILSPRWVNLWKYIPNLIFIDESFKPIPPIGNGMPFVRPMAWDVHSLKYAECVNSFINSYKALSVKQLTISFTIHPNAHHHVSKWLRFAFSKKVENLKLDFVCGFVLYYLDTNTLRSSCINFSDYKFLKELTLANFHVSGQAIEFLLRNCSLERLIMNVSLTSDLFIYTTLLKYLKIHCYSGKFIKVFAPNLTQLSCNYNYGMFLLEDVPNLVDASFGLAEPKATMRQFANAAAKLEILSIAVYRVQVIYTLYNIINIHNFSCIDSASNLTSHTKFLFHDGLNFVLARLKYKVVKKCINGAKTYYCVFFQLCLLL